MEIKIKLQAHIKKTRENTTNCDKKIKYALLQKESDKTYKRTIRRENNKIKNYE